MKTVTIIVGKNVCSMQRLIGIGVWT